MIYTFNDGLLPGSRRPRLYLAKAGEAVKFEGSSIDGYCQVVKSIYIKAGKWSNNDYELTLAPGVRPIRLYSPLHGLWGDDLASWGEVVGTLGLPIATCRAIVTAEYPKTAERLDAIEAFEAQHEDAHEDAERIVVSFGGPTRRQRAEGFWEQPKTGYGSGNREVVVAPGASGWASPVVVSPEGAKIVGVRHTPGHGGGYYDVEVMV